MESPIHDFVRKYAESGRSRLHMPGHKGVGPLGCERLDITEIDGADSLYTANGVIERSERRAAELFGSRRTFYSTGGSSQCIKAMLHIALQRRAAGGRALVLAARNVHTAFVHAAALIDFDVEWLWQEQGEEYQLLRCVVGAEALERALLRLPRLPDAVYVTSPDYLGQLQPVDELTEVCHRYNVPLLVDNAHGAYLHFLPKPLHPMDLGADLCCDSAHKTLPVLTGGAYLHLSEIPESDAGVRRALSLYGSTSPSYLTLQSLDLCNAYLADEFRSRLAETVDRVTALKTELTARGWTVEDTEPLKLVIRAEGSGMSGSDIARRLRRGLVECEYSDPDYVVMMFSPQNVAEDYARILGSLPHHEGAGVGAVTRRAPLSMSPPERVTSIREALFSPWEEIPVAEAVGRVCAAPTVSCPPAVPISVCGERIGTDAAAVFAHYGIETVCVLR